MSIPEILEPIEADLKKVRQVLLTISPPEAKTLADSIEHSLESKGKLLRPALSILVSRALQGSACTKAIDVASVSEMIHLATLLHDDVIDESDLRRGKATNRKVFGNTIAILSGDWLLAQASKKLADIGIIRIVAIFSQVLADLCDGEVEQLQSRFLLENLSWERYLKKSYSKTASLFAASCESAAVFAKAPEGIVQAMRSYGECFGLAFQLVDDWLDYSASESQLGKPVMDDLRNGLVNAPLLLALESEHLSDKGKVSLREASQDLFEASQNSDEVSAQRLCHTISVLMEKAQVQSQMENILLNYVDQAKNHLSALPDSESKLALLALCQSSLQRKK